MIIGLSSASFYPNIKTEDSIPLMKSLGFDVGEIFLNSASEYKPEFGKILLDRELQHDFKVNSIHAFSVSFEPYLFDDYKRRREDSLKLFKNVCRLAEIIGAGCYTFHGMRYRDIHSIDIDFIVDIYDRLMYIAGEHGVKLCQENVFWCMSNSIEFLYEIKDRCREHLYFTLDIKQAYKSGKSPEKYIDIMGTDIANFHINDRDSNSVCLLPGRGDVDYKKIACKFKEIEYNGVGIIEVYKDNYTKYNELAESKRYVEREFE
ncbi:MAG: sugar phosphate isomerase/epimerase [Clostridium sp.]|jgi:sugar phosphate isomerase/epimerase|uniref:sugar phosphate isomerase/epimerase family protein n=1 Tax=Clostridium sp. TaxID=1506 RepID=UPI0025BB9243|nr:sugar phosphate isomerase/epimerase [Clostridium sp.]MCH3962771.1 sugar phosphate isomerase/epimerase [Clostridium sp.]MCI1715814.1 sugar phosphate isomerase/epimerase [Clostridium sp.]MCI1799981.1 sugar phosphate isomerase/epimerase [Clostridium sp.]MCI1813895.1 sugar phosphate isomerase/epimerase [Clostridium sp.]MCI1870793.1 sugar phosphate isomerase/epimerase [Clostridium sp.]